MPRDERNGYLFAKLRSVRPVFRLDEVHDVIHSFDVLLDEPRRDPGLASP